MEELSEVRLDKVSVDNLQTFLTVKELYFDSIVRPCNLLTLQINLL